MARLFKYHFLYMACDINQPCYNTTNSLYTRKERFCRKKFFYNDVSYNNVLRMWIESILFSCKESWFNRYNLGIVITERSLYLEYCHCTSIFSEYYYKRTGRIG